jgi:predicted PurR-regulated permease PerM
MIPISANTPGARFLLMGASFVIVVAGLREGASILLPFALALFLAVMSMPLMFWLQLRRVPAPLAVVLTMLTIGVVFGALIMLGTQAVADFQGQLPGYRARVEALYASWVAGLSAQIGVQLDQYLTFELIDPGAAVDLFASTAARVAGFLTNTFLVLLIMAFILSEAMVFPFKFRAIVGPRVGERRRVTKMGPNDRRRMTKIVREVQEYLGIKTLMSLTTGLLIGLLAWVAGLDFPILLGLIGFVLNYIPTVGSILAAVPALLLSVVQFGSPGNFILVIVGYGAINTVFGNILEPNLMGRRLGLSTLVVILSLLFWAWVWGPVGALLAVPLTMVVKIMLENTEDLRWVAILLDKSPPQMLPSYEVDPSELESAGSSESAGSLENAGSLDVSGLTERAGTDAAAGDEEVA